MARHGNGLEAKMTAPLLTLDLSHSHPAQVTTGTVKSSIMSVTPPLRDIGKP